MTPSPETQLAIESSFLAGVSETTRNRILDHARLRTVPEGNLIYDAGSVFAALLVSGLLRVFSSEPNGRTVTFRNLVAGNAMGLGALVGVPDDIGIQAVTRSVILELDVRIVRQLRATDSALNLALAREIMRRLQETSRELVAREHGSARQRIARHLLDLAAEIGEGDPVAVAATHQEIADSIAFRRETVTRALADFVRMSAIRSGRGRIRIINPEILRSVATGLTGG